MLKYTIRRLSQLVLVLFLLSFLIFFWLRSLPGGYERSICAERCTPDKIAELRTVLGLDQPVFVQYFKFLGRIAQGNFGTPSGKRSPAFSAAKQARAVFLERFPATIELSVLALIIAVLIGVPLGYVAAQRKGGILDNLSVTATLVGIAVPVFFLAYLLKYVFAVKLGWLPPSGRQEATLNATRVTGFFVVDGLITRE